MTPEEHQQDPQDKQFGAAASRDQDLVDELSDKEGLSEDELPDQPQRAPRAGDKARPDGE